MVSTGLENAVLNGIITGSFIALGAIGLSLVYNIADVPNFAHGELLMIGAYFALLVNTPLEVPGLRRLASDGDPVTGGVMAVLFLLTAGAALGIVYILGGVPALKGGWWPIEPPTPGVAVGVHVLVAVVLGLFVARTAPSIWAGFVLSGLLLAFIGPFFDKYVFKKFRETGAELPTILMATMGLAFVLRFTMQAVFSGTIRSYDVDRTVELAGSTIDVTRAKFFDYYVTGEGLVIEIIDTAPDPHETVYLGGYSWPVVAGIVVGTVVVAYGAYRWRGAGIGEHEAVQTIGPRIVGPVAGLLTMVALFVLLGGPATRPDGGVVYSSRIRTSVIRLAVVIVAVILMTGLHVVLKETKLGKAMRAASDNLDLAKVTGINTDRVMMVTWIIAGGFAAIGGIVIGILFHQIVPSMGFYRLLPIFAAVILGGLASVYGAIVGAFAVGVAMEVGFYSINLVTPISGTHRVSLAFVLLLVVLLVRPEGIVGGQ